MKVKKKKGWKSLCRPWRIEAEAPTWRCFRLWMPVIMGRWGFCVTTEALKENIHITHLCFPFPLFSHSIAAVHSFVACTVLLFHSGNKHNWRRNIRGPRASRRNHHLVLRTLRKDCSTLALQPRPGFCTRLDFFSCLSYWANEISVIFVQVHLLVILHLSFWDESPLLNCSWNEAIILYSADAFCWRRAKSIPLPLLLTTKDWPGAWINSFAQLLNKSNTWPRKRKIYHRILQYRSLFG